MKSPSQSCVGLFSEKKTIIDMSKSVAESKFISCGDCKEHGKSGRVCPNHTSFCKYGPQAYLLVEDDMPSHIVNGLLHPPAIRARALLQ